MAKLASFKFVFGMAAAILALHSIAGLRFWYWRIWWLDMPMHFLGGFWLALVLYWYLKIANRTRIFEELKFLERFVLILSFAVFAGTFWEFYELFYDALLRTGPPLFVGKTAVFDTLKDLAFDMLGGATAFLLAERKFVNGVRSEK